MPSPLNGLNIVTVDFETYFDGDYNLRKQGIETSTYVRDERFEVLCVGIRTARAKQAKAGPGHRAATELNRIDWSKTALLGHHSRRGLGQRGAELGPQQGPGVDAGRGGRQGSLP